MAAGSSTLRHRVDDYSEELPTVWSLDPAPPPGEDDPHAFAASPPARGDVLKGRFELHEQLSSRGATRVFRALDRRRQEAGARNAWVAIKTVTCEPGSESRALHALRQEAVIGQRLTHQSIVRIFDIDRDDMHSFMSMELLSGESLVPILDGRQQRPMPRLQAVHIIEGICRALAHAHAQGIIHADVKPGNVFVTQDGHAKLLDFGMARTANAGDDPADRGYTPQYASPEVLKGSEPEARDDLFSVACIAYRMLSGHRAFGHLDAREAEAAELRPVRIDALSPAQWRALDTALSFARADRQADVNTFIAQLRGPRDDAAHAGLSLNGFQSGAAPDASGPARDAAATLVTTLFAGKSRVWIAAAGAAAMVAVLAAVLTRPDGASAPSTAPSMTHAPAMTPAPARKPASAEGAAAPRSSRVGILRRPGVPPVASATAGAVDETSAGDQAGTASAGTVRGGTRSAGTATAGTGRIASAVSRASGSSPKSAAVRATTPVAGNRSAGPITEAPRSSTSAARTQGAAASTEVAGPPKPSALTGTGSARAGAQSGMQPGALASLPSSPPASAAGSMPAIVTVPFSSLKVRRYVEASYPRDAEARRMPGWVDIAFQVDRKGHTDNVQVIAAEPSELFEDAALSAVRRWRFESPGDSTVRSRIRVRFEPD